MRAMGVTDSSDYSDEWRAKRRREIETSNDRQRKADLVESYKKLRRE